MGGIGNGMHLQWVKFGVLSRGTGNLYSMVSVSSICATYVIP
jgi:hypothetical protein